MTQLAIAVALMTAMVCAFSVQIHLDVRSEPAAALQVPLTPTPEKP